MVCILYGLEIGSVGPLLVENGNPFMWMVLDWDFTLFASSHLHKACHDDERRKGGGIEIESIIEASKAYCFPDMEPSEC